MRKARREENSKRRKAANKAAKVAAKLAGVEVRGLQDGEEMVMDGEGGRSGGEKKRRRKGRNGHKDELSMRGSHSCGRGWLNLTFRDMSRTDREPLCG